MENSYLNLPVDDGDSLLQLQGLLAGRLLSVVASPWGHNKAKRCLLYKPYPLAQMVNMVS
jgi:hypothetical protein